MSRVKEYVSLYVTVFISFNDLSKTKQKGGFGPKQFCAQSSRDWRCGGRSRCDDACARLSHSHKQGPEAAPVYSSSSGREVSRRWRQYSSTVHWTRPLPHISCPPTQVCDLLGTLPCMLQTGATLQPGAAPATTCCNPLPGNHLQSCNERHVMSRHVKQSQVKSASLTSARSELHHCHRVWSQCKRAATPYDTAARRLEARLGSAALEYSCKCAHCIRAQTSYRRRTHLSWGSGLGSRVAWGEVTHLVRVRAGARARVSMTLEGQG